jgi:hypothetical protein
MAKECSKHKIANRATSKRILAQIIAEGISAKKSANGSVISIQSLADAVKARAGAFEIVWCWCDYCVLLKVVKYCRGIDFVFSAE